MCSVKERVLLWYIINLREINDNMIFKCIFIENIILYVII